MKNEMMLRPEWKYLLSLPVIVIGVGIFAWVAMAGIWYVTPDDEQRGLTFSELLADAFGVTALFALLLPLVVVWIVWSRLWSWKISESDLHIYFAGRLTKTIPLGSLDSVSFAKVGAFNGISVYWSGLRKERRLNFISRRTALTAIDRWVQQRANKSGEGTA